MKTTQNINDHQQYLKKDKKEKKLLSEIFITQLENNLNQKQIHNFLKRFNKEIWQTGDIRSQLYDDLCLQYYQKL
jgi:hypothetical protein